MGLSELKSKTIFLDSAPLIYFIEDVTPYTAALTLLFAAHDRNELTLVASALTYLEVLVVPIRMSRWDLVDKYTREITEVSGIQIVEVNRAIAYKAAEVRAKYRIKTPDAIQIATALETKANYFLTNDFRLKQINEITIITPEQL
jgi:predicted nucleic acid-binding protein